MMTHAMNCDTVDERLADYLEGELAASDEGPHLVDQPVPRRGEVVDDRAHVVAS